jgi:hypothetical protein
MLAEKLNMSMTEAEKWIVDLIRNARLDAKIDSKLVLRLVWCKLSDNNYAELCVFLFLGARCIWSTSNKSNAADYRKDKVLVDQG